MANPTDNSMNGIGGSGSQDKSQRTSQTLRQASSQAKDKVEQARSKVETIRDRAQDLASEAGSKLRDITGQTSERASEVWEQAGSWLSENRSIGFIGLAVAVGVAGFFIGRASVSSDLSDIAT